MDAERKTNFEIDLLKLEYQECQLGYRQRDSLIENEFCRVVELFVLLITAVFLLDRFAAISWVVHCTGCLILGIAGLLLLVSLLVSIESSASCNFALRQRCQEIEKRLHELTGFEVLYWRTIGDRRRYFEEGIVKRARKPMAGGKTPEITERKERSISITTVRLLIILWFIVVIVAILPGQEAGVKAGAVSF